ncbi:MAG: FG-GAP repeat protein [Chitinophagales bacterium]|nr:FG-GAP repeat protein [Bacteroidota bacterium]MBP8915204.1 FG-GAP repeat protein [Chitinophagales bacterium]MBP9220763.1 FG-GAP repeat protein [Chitinophagales bacterium]MBP9794494.1 FG-GAP repeat protein [Chitinophagales bacterium]
MTNKVFLLLSFLIPIFISSAQVILPDEIIFCDQSAQFGSAVSSIGDVNGDGYGDIGVGAYSYDNGELNEGRVYIFHGSNTGIDSIPELTLESNQASANFGFAVSGAGDVNGDGFDDIIIGAYNFDNGQTNEGAAFIYLGSASGINPIPNIMLESNQASANFGWSVSGAGDINADGFDDIIVGAQNYDNGNTNEGAAFIYHGSATGINGIANIILEINSTNAAFGTSVSDAGDINNDGFDDIIVGAPDYNSKGKVNVYHGSVTGLNSTPNSNLLGFQNFAEFGYSISSAGDVNNDGFDDIIIGAYQHDNIESNEGRATIYIGTSDGIYTSGYPREINQVDAQFGYSVSGAGDVNADGYDDVIIGARYYENGESNEGAGFIFLGSDFPYVGLTPFNIMEGNQFGGNVGSSVAGSVDFNGDGTSDLFIGGTLYDNGVVAGAALIYYYAGCLQNFYLDGDGDGYGNALIDTLSCSNIIGFVTDTTDCDDSQFSTHPGAAEYLNGIDENCDGILDNLAPVIEWQTTIGGSEYERLSTIQESEEGGYIIGGFSTSDISGDKTVINNGSDDYWILKLDVDGNIDWQKVYGGNNSDFHGYTQQTSDGGFILSGHSYSRISGDKTEDSIGYSDFWIIKIDAIGNIEWQNTIGGNNFDLLYCPVKQTTDGGYILGGTSDSGMSGDKIEPSIGSLDMWIIKLDESGNIDWQNTIGGSSVDELKSIEQTDDGGFIIGGDSHSGITGDKTEANNGSDDWWILKLDAFGNIVWQNVIGGSGTEGITSMIQTFDGGFIGVGLSYSGISGDKSEPNIGFADNWIVKLNNIGEIEWDRTIGGNDYESPTSILQTTENTFLIGSYTSSDISGYKSENCFGGDDFWYFMLDQDGEFLWDKSQGGSQSDLLLSIVQTSDGGFILGGASNSDISGTKTEMSEGGMDYWIIKLSPICSPSPELCNSLDDNCNGLIDDGITETISISAGGPITFCQGGNVLLTATYSGATVQWKKNGTNIPGATSPTYLVNIKGTYTCVTTSPCGTTLSSPIMVNVIKNPPASITAGGATTFCAGGSVILTANAGGGLSYQWYKGASIIAGATSINYTATLAGNYKCRVTKTATGCFKNSNVIIVSVPCKEGELVNDENAFTIFPNPNDGTFTIEANVKTQDFASSESTIEIYNNLGQLIYSKEINSNDGLINENIEIKNIIPGIYLVKLWNNNIHNVKNIIIE